MSTSTSSEPVILNETSTSEAIQPASLQPIFFRATLTYFTSQTSQFASRPDAPTINANSVSVPFIDFKETIKEKFHIYKSRWISQTQYSSSTHEIVNNDAYKSIIALGKDVVPYIIADLKNTSNHWFYALQALTGENPVKKEHRGVVPLMTEDWLEWAKNNNQIDNDIAGVSEE